MQLQLAIKIPTKPPDKAITFIWYKGKWKLARAPLEPITKGPRKGQFRTMIYSGQGTKGADINGLKKIIIKEGDIKK